MVSISPDELALELLNQCLRGNSHSTDLLETLLRLAQSPDPAQARKASRALFGIVVERLGDLFDPCLCDSYAALFSDVISFALPDLDASILLDRYKRVRTPRKFEGNAERVRDVFVLSRVTLGADVAITSLCLAAMKQRFPVARIYLVGPRKNFELFAGDPRISHAPIAYGREGTLSERLSVYPVLHELLDVPGAVIVDPDSRLTQLGLLPVCAEEHYYFFESRGYGEYGPETLPALTRRWLDQTFSISDVSAFLAPADTVPGADITISLGVGENPSKRIGDPFERRLLEHLAGKGRSILIDRGGSPDESARVDRTIDGLDGVRTWTGSFAPFAGAIAKSKLYTGYDSAGQHVAAACGTPLLTIFAGFPSPRMFQRWSPDGPGPKRIVQVDNPDPAAAYEAAARAIDELLS
ncbi:MAG: hypothetical protein JNL98_27005 [Bryobacterales bacterium]|nr:hypothetical protein [Bryobacterales bacterium]